MVDLLSSSPCKVALKLQIYHTLTGAIVDFFSSLVVCRWFLIVASKPLPAAPLVLRRRYLIVMPRPQPRCASQVLDRGAQADARGAAKFFDRDAQAAVRVAARCASQVLGRGAQPVA
jgi:hypothetical protein